MLLMDTLMEMVATVGEIFGLMIESLWPRRRPAWRSSGGPSEIS